MLAIGSLTACSNQPVDRPVVVSKVEGSKWPDLPPVERPAKPRVQAWQYDYPRDLSQPQIVASRKSCLSVAPAKQDASFWGLCGVYPIDPKSNLFIGFEREQWDILLKNLQELEAYYSASQATFDELDRQRETWRKRNSAAEIPSKLE